MPRSWCILSFANGASVMQFFENSWRSPTAPFDYGHTARTPRLTDLRSRWDYSATVCSGKCVARFIHPFPTPSFRTGYDSSPSPSVTTSGPCSTSTHVPSLIFPIRGHGRSMISGDDKAKTGSIPVVS